MNEDRFEDMQRSDASLVRSTRCEIIRAGASLTARPLDEEAAAQMRRALESQAAARAALRRPQMGEHPAAPRLVVVSPGLGRWSYDEAPNESSG